MEWEKEEIKKELISYFSKGKAVEVVEMIEKEIAETLVFEKFSEKKGNVSVDGVDYIIIQNEDEAERIAIEQVKNDLEDDPTMFNQGWLQDFLSISECDKRMMSSEEEDYIRELVAEDAEDIDFENDSEKEIYIEKEVEKRVKEYAECLEDPIEYFVNDQGMYSIEDLMKQNWICIDIKEASKEAVQVDGWAHFLSRYDGNYEETDNGLIIFQDC